MNMALLAQVCIYVPMICYAVAALAFAFLGNVPMSITYAAYSVGNIGLAMAARQSSVG